MKWLLQHLNGDLGRIKLRGTSAGALVATFVACGVDLDKAVGRATELMVQHGVYERYRAMLFWEKPALIMQHASRLVGAAAM
jgi:predicted acylesterase/phospholipase RssA